MSGILEPLRRQLAQLKEEQEFDEMFKLLRRYVDDGLAQGRFSQEQVAQDLELALEIAYADLNINQYEAYHQAIFWLERVEQQARQAGEGRWFYRLSVAYTYIGKLEQALQISQEGVKAAPGYVWGWLHLAALLAHDGQRQAALQAVETGLALRPQDPEFCQLRRQIMQGESLEQMLSDAPNPEEEPALPQKPGSEGCRSEQEISVMCICCDAQRLEQVKQALKLEKWEFDGMYCTFAVPYDHRMIEGNFSMNEAGASKFSPQWMARLREQLPRLDQLAGQKVAQEHPDCRVELGHLIFERSGCFCLGYHVGRSREQRLFAYLRFNPQFEPEQELEYTDYSSNYNQEQGEREIPLHKYTPQERRRLEQHIRSQIGSWSRLLEEEFPQGVQSDVLVLEPTRRRPYYTLVTLGMGAARMKVPKELADCKVDRAELLLRLPPDWKLDSSEQRWQWPIQWLRMLARLPLEQDTWLGWGHTVPNGRPFASNTQLSGMVLIAPLELPEGAAVCPMEDGSEVNFYQVIPIYDEEMDYKLEHDAQALLARLEQQGVLSTGCVELQRPNTCCQQQDLPTDPQLLEQLAIWHDNEQYKDIVDAIEQIPSEQRSYLLIGQLARAYNNLQQYHRAIDLLLSVQQRGKSDPLWHFRLGFAYYYTNQEAKALQAFCRSEELAPGSEDTQQFIRWCRSALALPVSVRPFKSRSQAFWQAFASQEQTLRTLLGHGQQGQAMRQLGQLLQDHLGWVDFMVEPMENSRFLLAISIGHHRLEAMKYLFWRDQAPQSLAACWELQVGLPPKTGTDWKIQYQGCALACNLGQVWWEGDPKEGVGIRLYHPQLVNLEPAAQEQAAWLLLEAALGQAACMGLVDGVEVLAQPLKQGQGCSLHELPGQLEASMGQQLYSRMQDARRLAFDLCGYRCNPSTREDFLLRQDIIVGSNLCSELVRQYYQDMDECMEQQQASGAICGFFYYDQTNVPEQELVELRTAIEYKLQQRTAHCMQLLGGACGLKYAYMDCMCFDLKECLDAASALLNEYDFPEIGFHVFRMRCGSVNLKDR